MDEDDHLDDDLHIGPGTSGSFDDDREDETVSTEDAVGTLVASLHLAEWRRRRPVDPDDDRLRTVHERLAHVVNRDHEDQRRRRLRKALPLSNCVREQVFYLRRIAHSANPMPTSSYFPRLSSALASIVDESFDEDSRKAAALLGVSEALAEILILEVAIFTTVPPHQPSEHRSVRKLIGNALTNLTFGNVAIKRRLCGYDEFMPTVVRLIADAHNLAQVYAGLIRNLSWMAEREMCAVLAPCVRALASAAIRAKHMSDEGCVRATLSAVWNLASHSKENKRAICEEPGFLTLLASLLTPDTRMTAVVESASGILKYASQYLSETSTHLDERKSLCTRLVQLLTSSSFTVSNNALGAIASLIAKDPHLQTHIRMDALAMHQLNSLRSSAREDIRNAVKTVLNHLNQPSAYTTRLPEMSASMGMDTSYLNSGSRDAGRLLHLRGMRASPGAPNLHQLSGSVDTRCSSLPRHFSRGGAVFSPNSQRDRFAGYSQTIDTKGHGSFAPASAFVSQRSPRHHRQQPVEDEHSSSLLPSDDGLFDEVKSDSVICDHSYDQSRQSLNGSEAPTGWNSAMDTSENSARVSPVSASELPDSPTHFAIQSLMNRMQQNTLQSTTSNNTDTSNSEGLRVQIGGSGGSDATTALVQDEATPTYPFPQQTTQVYSTKAQTSNDVSSPQQQTSHTANRCQQEASFSSPHHIAQDLNRIQIDSPGSLPAPEDDYGLLKFGGDDGDLLQKSIEAVLPPATPRTVRKNASQTAKDSLLSSMIESAMPSPNKGTLGRKTQQQQQHNDDDNQLLMDCIMSAMPAGSQLSPKNERGGRVDDSTSTRDRPQTSSRQASDMQRSALLQTKHSCVKDASILIKQQFSVDSSSSDEFYTDFDDEVVDVLDTTLPEDCVGEEEPVTIDCSPLSNGQKICSTRRSRLPCPNKNLSRLPTPEKSRLMARKGVETLKKPKNAQPKSAVIPPFNYQQPKKPETKETCANNEKESSPGAMLVTTV